MLSSEVFSPRSRKKVILIFSSHTVEKRFKNTLHTLQIDTSMNYTDTADTSH